ncbi:Helix-destabilizing protein [Chlamydia trachomatis]|nr:Helix-destabilizing protein [Chlamydia trachomatis]CRH54783.1 Helix-destabilizing protein [Chlamydia trachomatis]
MNSVHMIGRLVSKPQLGLTKNNKPYSKFVIAIKKDINKKYTTIEEGRQTDYFNCLAFNNNASFINNFLDKGDLVSITGKLNYLINTSNESTTSNYYFVDIKTIEPLESKEVIEKRRSLNNQLDSNAN